MYTTGKSIDIERRLATSWGWREYWGVDDILKFYVMVVQPCEYVY